MPTPTKPKELRRGTDRVPGKIKANGEAYPSTEIVVPDDAEITIPDPVELTGHGFAERGQLVWSQVYAESGWRMTAEDIYQLEIMCRNYDRIDQEQDRLELWQRAVDDTGLYLFNKHLGMNVANPMIAEIRKSQSLIARYELLILKCLSEIGYGPSARTRLGFRKVKEADAMLDLENKVKKNRRGE